MKNPIGSLTSSPSEKEIVIRDHFTPTLSSNQIEDSTRIAFCTHSLGVMTLVNAFLGLYEVCDKTPRPVSNNANLAHHRLFGW